jgi:hypothetical protein
VTRPRTPEHFPRMKDRAAGRRIRRARAQGAVFLDILPNLSKFMQQMREAFANLSRTVTQMMRHIGSSFTLALRVQGWVESRRRQDAWVASHQLTARPRVLGLEPVHLHAEGLTSKWGFSDGDLLGDWIFDNAYELQDQVDSHDVLIDLVRAYLIPELAAHGHVVELDQFITIHNPLRARTINGVEIDWYAAHDVARPIADISVTLSGELVHTHVQHHAAAAPAEGNQP